MAMSSVQLASVERMLQEVLDEQRGSPSLRSDEAPVGENLADVQYQFLGFLEGESEAHNQSSVLNDEVTATGRYLVLGLQ